MDPKVVKLLTDHGHHAVAASPNTGVNTITGEGLAEVLTDASAVVDVSNSPSLEGDAAVEFFQKSTGNLLAAEAAAGVGHHIALSVVGTDEMAEAGSGYMRAKQAQEELIAKSDVPYSIVHATQFFEFLKGITDAATEGDTVRLAPVFIRPMASADVAKAVAKHRSASRATRSRRSADPRNSNSTSWCAPRWGRAMTPARSSRIRMRVTSAPNSARTP